MTDTALAKLTAPASPLRQVVAWIIAGNSEPDVLDAIAAQFPNEKTKPLIVSALKDIAKSGEPDPAVVRGFAIEGTRTIYQKALELGDHATALRALKQLVDLTH